MEQLFDQIVSSELQSRLIIWRVVFGLMSLLLIAFIGFVLTKSSYVAFLFGYNWKEFAAFKAFGLRPLAKRWRKIQKHLESGREDEYKLAVLEAEKLMEDIFKRMGYGPVIETQLQKVPTVILPNIEELKGVHVVRNSIAHDPNYRLSEEQARQTLEIYERSLRALDVL